MFFFSAVSAALALSSSTSAFSISGGKSPRDAAFKLKVAESLDAPPAGWLVDDGAKFDKDASTVTLRIHLMHQNMDKFHELATNIATPGHAVYGQHLEQHVIDSMIAPRVESNDLVMQWLRGAGLATRSALSPRADAVVVNASVSQVEKLLNAKYSAFVHVVSGDVIARTLEYSLPEVLKGHVDFVQPTTFFGLDALRSVSHIQPENQVTSSDAKAIAVTGCTSGDITPNCLQNLYNFVGANKSQSVGRMGIAGFLEQYPSKPDLSTFLRTYAVQGNTAETYSCTLINGGLCPTTGRPGVEANLDVQIARAITANIPNIYYSVGGRPPQINITTNEPYLEFINYLLALPAAQLPNTISISYGDDQATVPLSYATTVCNLFSQLGARGVSILAASGDSGVGTTCTTAAGTRRFQTLFPASCPWITTVGGTDGTAPEAAWSGGGGGFSEIFGRPSYQESTVSSWLATDQTHVAVNPYFNASGRAYPDVSAQSTNYLIVLSGLTSRIGGTSAACPTVASIIQLLNSGRIQVGKAPLGFLNPWLYSRAKNAFNDITTGKIGGCSGIAGAGFSAVSGWDPATGLGTPNYEKLFAVSNAT